MPIDVPMPKLGLTMHEGRIIEWLVADGAIVVADDDILLIETDKTETTIASPGSGRLHQIGRPGETYECGQRVAWLLAEGESAPSSPTPPVHGGRIMASPNARRLAATMGMALAAVRGTGPGGRIVSEDVEAAALALPESATPQPESAVVATAAARHLAGLLGVDLALVPADPIEGRVTREAVARRVRTELGMKGRAGPAPKIPQIPLLQEPSEIVPLTGMRGTIARRMHASLRDSAQLTLTMDADMEAVVADRARRRHAAPVPVPSITDYVVAAAARALVGHPLMNAQVTEAGIALLPAVHVGLAVAVDGGLVVPVIRDTATRSLDDLAAETTRLADLARSGKLAPGDLEGGTFAVSSLGAFGVDSFTPVLNPPNVGILGVGRVRDDVAVVDDRVVTVPRLTLSLTWDHRTLDGAPAAEFCRTVATLLATLSFTE